MTRYELFIPNWLPVKENGPKGRARRHWGQTKRDKQLACDLVFFTHRGHSLDDLPRFKGEVKCEYTRYRTRGPAMDDDGLYGSWKDLGDALETLGVVENDRHIRLTAKQFLRDFMGTRIVIEGET